MNINTIICFLAVSLTYCLGVSALKGSGCHRDMTSMTMSKNFFGISGKNTIRSIPIIISAFAAVNIQPANAEFITSPWSNNIKYEVVKAAPADAPLPKIGDTVSVRFAAKYKDFTFDDTFKTEQPYMFRAGVGLVVKGMDESVMQMHVGDRFKLQFGGDYAFPNGKPSSPGRPRIMAGADVEYEIELVELPGQGDDFIADVE